MTAIQLERKTWMFLPLGEAFSVSIHWDRAQSTNQFEFAEVTSELEEELNRQLIQQQTLVFILFCLLPVGVYGSRCSFPAMALRRRFEPALGCSALRDVH